MDSQEESLSSVNVEQEMQSSSEELSESSLTKRKIKNDGQSKQVQLCKGEEQQMSQKGKKKKEDLQDIMLRQELNKYKQVPPFALLCALVILKITEFPKRQKLQESSLLDQICVMISKFRNIHLENKELIAKIKKLQLLFDGGVQRKKYFDQGRIQKAGNKIQNDKILKIQFNPTHTVTGQIFRQLVHQRQQKYSVSYGHHGIAKTFGYYLYHEISNLFIQETIECYEQVLKILEQKEILCIPKLIYLNMKLEATCFDQEAYVHKLKESITEQCPQISMYIQNIENYKTYAQHICDIYTKKGVKVFLLVDQINSIASNFRKYQAKKLCLEEYQITVKKNNIRYDLASSGFDSIIYNSSVNCEYFYAPDDLSQENISQESFKKAAEQLRLRQDNESTLGQLPILYLQIIKFESTIWELADLIIFELNKKIKMSPQQKQQQNQQKKKYRKKLFNFLKKRQNNSAITFLLIREIISPLNLQSISEYIKIIKARINQKQNTILSKCLINFINKIQKTQENNTVTYILYKILEKDLNQIKLLKQNFVYQKQKQIEQIDQIKQIKYQIDKNLSFLASPIFCNNSLNPEQFLSLDRTFFRYLYDFHKISTFMSKIMSFTITALLNWHKLNQEITVKKQIKQKLKQFQSQMIQKKKNKQQVIICFLPSQLMIQLIQPKISQMSQLNLQKIISALGSPDSIEKIFETHLIRYIENTENVQFFDQNNVCIFSKDDMKMKQLKMSQLPKLSEKYHYFGKKRKKVAGKQQNQKENENESEHQEQQPNQMQPQITFHFENLPQDTKQMYEKFINQFLDDQKQVGYYLYKPQNATSKSIDFALQSITQKYDSLYEYNICLFQVTMLSHITKIRQKIQMFLDGFRYAVEYFLNKAQLLKKKKKRKFIITFMLIGVAGNEAILKRSVQQNNKSLFFKLIKEKINQKYEDKSIKLNQIKWVNFNSMSLPKIANFQYLNAMKQIFMKDCEHKKKQNEEQKIRREKRKEDQKIQKEKKKADEKLQKEIEKKQKQLNKKQEKKKENQLKIEKQTQKEINKVEQVEEKEKKSQNKNVQNNKTGRKRSLKKNNLQ